MKRNSISRWNALLFAAAMVAAPCALHAQADLDPSAGPQMQQQPNQQQGSHRPASIANQDSTPIPGMTGQEMKDKMFLRKVAEGGIAEVKLGQLAAEKGGSEDVKSFGSKMVADHTTINNQIKPIADSLGVRLPKDMSKADQAEYDRLNALSGAEFDQAYLLAMVTDHRKDLREFHMESMSTNDASLREVVDKAAAVIREHTMMVSRMAREKGIALPPGGRPGGPGGMPGDAPSPAPTSTPPAPPQ